MSRKNSVRDVCRTDSSKAAKSAAYTAGRAAEYWQSVADAAKEAAEAEARGDVRATYAATSRIERTLGFASQYSSEAQGLLGISRGVAMWRVGGLADEDDKE